MTRRENYEKMLRKYGKSVIEPLNFEDGEEPLKFLIFERKIAYIENRALYMFQVHNFNSSVDMWNFIAGQYSFQSSGNDHPVFVKEQVIDLDTGEDVTEKF